jgi:lysophospholipase L1-like esterase
LAALLRKGKKTGAYVLLVTVPHILGEQMPEYTASPYDRFVEASIQAGENEAVPIADVNRVFRQVFNASLTKKSETDMFSDNWHVTAIGHQLYAQSIWEYLVKLLAMGDMVVNKK